jgi:hypothetical protein
LSSIYLENYYSALTESSLAKLLTIAALDFLPVPVHTLPSQIRISGPVTKGLVDKYQKTTYYEPDTSDFID